MKDVYKWAYIENVITLVLAGFLCWIFRNPLGLIVLLNINFTKKKHKGGDERDGLDKM